MNDTKAFFTNTMPQMTFHVGRDGSKYKVALGRTYFQEEHFKAAIQLQCPEASFLSME